MPGKTASSASIANYPRFCERVGVAKGRIRRIAIVAMARRLLIALWRYLETGLTPAGAVLRG
jgi:transposase